ncbi:hypothetical protein ACHAXA_006327 [Cyclostephanos tholiformis]|uniref:Uncharacterized protein n=1 Tax=Cyclostephanos tholiformis TaxID=382380 RepID=A0ABD3R144_9STRA
MGFEYARDSYVDLINVKNERHDQKQRQETKIFKETSGKSLKKQTSFRTNKGGGEARLVGDAKSASASAAAGVGGYGGCASSKSAFSGKVVYPSQDGHFFDPCEVDDEEEFPIWEMTGNDPWKNDDSIASASGENSSHPCSGTLSIAACERIFTVPEVYEEIQLRDHSARKLKGNNSIFDGRDQEPCDNIFHCFNPWKRSLTPIVEGQDAGSRNSTPGHLHRLPSEISILIHEGQQHNQICATKLSSLAVQLYLGMPGSYRQSFHPSFYKICLDDSVEDGDSGGRTRARIVGYDHNIIYPTSGMINANDSKASSALAKSKKRKVYFSELKRVLRVRKFTCQESSEIWFQREDFEYFRSEMTLLVQESEASRELAQVWFEAHENRRKGTVQPLETCEEGAYDSHCMSTNDCSVGSSAKQVLSRSWWHDYNHSRRGLERYASPGQARQILASYKVAVNKVLAEQQRQRLLSIICVPGSQNPDKIAEVYHEYTAWSRDLALAAGASDADAVRTNFDDEKRHTREYYMLKQVVASGFKVHKHMPQFMYPKCITPTGFMDETETLYFDGKKTSSLLDNIAKIFSKRNRSLTGAEAREEMSHLHTKDMQGPVSPSLLASLHAKEQVNTKMAADVPENKAKLDSTQKSMAERAKNFPFQQ